MFDIFDECVYVCNIDVVNVFKCFYFLEIIYKKIVLLLVKKISLNVYIFY